MARLRGLLSSVSVTLVSYLVRHGQRPWHNDPRNPLVWQVPIDGAANLVSATIAIGRAVPMSG